MVNRSVNSEETNKKREVLITGASGFIGQFLVAEALDRGYSVSVTVRKSTSLRDLKNKNVQIILTDLSDSGLLNETISRLPVFDGVIHNAGITKTIRRKDYAGVNYGHTRRLIEAFKLQNKIPGKFLFMSSLAAYGPGENNSSRPVNSQSVPAPLTSYGKSKLAADQYITKESGIPYLILHPTAVYGPGDKDFLQTVKLIQKGIDFQIGMKPQHLTFIYVKDLARLAFDALESDRSNRSYLVSDGHLYNHLDLGRIVGNYLGRKPLHVALPYGLAWLIGATAELLSRLSGKPSILSREKMSEFSACNWNCDTNPLTGDFHFRAEYDLEKGMAETIAWYWEAGWLK